MTVHDQAPKRRSLLLHSLLLSASTLPASCDHALTYDQYLEETAKARCSVGVRCGNIGPSQLQACIRGDVARSAEVAKAYGTRDGLAAGRLIFDPEEARRCLDDLPKQHCFGGTPPCQALRGTVETGRLCRTDLECVTGNCTAGNGCAGVCQPFIETGYSCFDQDVGAAQCAPTDYCAPDWRCRPRPDVGAECPGRGCKRGLDCLRPTFSDDRGTCAPPRQDGEPCGPGSLSFCDVGLYCDSWLDPMMTGKPGTCRKKAAAGAACAWTTCQDGLACADGVCMAFADIGLPCVGAPKQGNCAGAAGMCDETEHICKLQGPALGESCAELPMECRWEIGESAYCDGTICRRRLGLGESCTPGLLSNPCEVGWCDPATRTCSLNCG